jgi:hypothetical protein
MRFMMLMIPRVYQGADGNTAGAEFAPSAEMVERMMKYNEELAKSGALVALDGLRPPAMGARVSFSEGKARVTDGPFTESKEVLGGYWMIDVKSREEAVEWAMLCPAEEGDIVEVRQVFETSDFPPDVREASENPAVRAQVEKHAGGAAKQRPSADRAH